MNAKQATHMETKGGINTFRGGCDSLGNHLPAEYTPSASGHEQVHGTEEVHLDLLDFKRRRNLGALNLVVFLHTEGGDETKCEDFRLGFKSNILDTLPAT